MRGDQVAGNEGVLVMGDIGGKDQRVIDRVSGAYDTLGSLAWRPDGQALAYLVSLESKPGGTGGKPLQEIRLWAAATDGIRVLRKADPADSYAFSDIAWAPDGEHLASIVTNGWATSAQRDEVQIWSVPKDQAAMK